MRIMMSVMAICAACVAMLTISGIRRRKKMMTRSRKRRGMMLRSRHG